MTGFTMRVQYTYGQKLTYEFLGMLADEGLRAIPASFDGVDCKTGNRHSYKMQYEKQRRN